MIMLDGPETPPSGPTFKAVAPKAGNHVLNFVCINLILFRNSQFKRGGRVEM